MREFDDGLQGRIHGQRHAVAEGPMVSAAVTREGCTHECTPQHDEDCVREERRGCDGETSRRLHRATMESNSTSVNDGEPQRVLLTTALVVDDQLGGGA